MANTSASLSLSCRPFNLLVKKVVRYFVLVRGGCALVRDSGAMRVCVLTIQIKKVKLGNKLTQRRNP